MIFDRIDIFVVCIIFGCCLTIAEVFIGTWGGFVLLFLMTSLITEVCYTLRCNEKLKKELTKAQAGLWFEKELNIRKEAFIAKYSLVIDLWRAKWKYENAKVSFIKREITSKEFIAAMGDTEEKIHDISNKIAIADFELKKNYTRGNNNIFNIPPRHFQMAWGFSLLTVQIVDDFSVGFVYLFIVIFYIYCRNGLFPNGMTKRPTYCFERYSDF